MKNFLKNKMLKRTLLGLSLALVMVAGVLIFNTQTARSAVSDNFCNAGDATITTPASGAAVGGTGVTVAWTFNGTDCTTEDASVLDVQVSHNAGADWVTVVTSALPSSTSAAFNSTAGQSPDDSDYQFRLNKGGSIIYTTSYSDVIIDNTAPILSSAVTADDDHDGKIDRVRVALTEPIGMADTCGTTGWTITADGSEVLAVASCAKFDTNHLDLTLTENDDVTTNDTPSIAYSSVTGNTTDKALNEITTGTIANAVDAAAPAVNITAPLTTNVVNASKVITFTDSEITDAECSVDAGAHWTNCTTGATTLNDIAEFAGLAEGAFTLSLRDIDAATNAGGDSEADIIKDTTDPVIGVANIVGTSVNGAGDTIAITFTDANAVSAVDSDWTDKDEITSITGTLSGALTLTNATFSYSAPTLTITLDEATDHEYLTNTEFLHVVPAVGTIKDAAGNFVAITEVEGTTAVTGDTAAPTVALTYATDSTTYKHNDAVTITATFDEEVYGAGAGTVPQITIVSPGDGDVTLADMVISGGTHKVWTYAWTVGDGDGTAAITIVAKDYAGNDNSAATNATKIVDNTLPVVTFTAGAGNDVEAGPVQTDTVNLTVTEANANTADHHYAFSADALCTAADTYDNDFVSTEAFVISASTNNAKYICGRAVDLAGNIGYSAASANDLNIDDVLPVVSAITLPAGATYKIGGNIQVGITADADSYSAHAITVNGKDVAASLTDDGAGAYHVHYIIAENDTDVLAAGTLTASVVLEDGVGNNNVAYTTVTEGAGDVIVDAHKPTLSTVSIVSNNAHDTTYAKTGDLITLTFVASENLAASPVVTIRGHAADAVTQGADAAHWTATYTMVAGDTEGAVPFTINFTDIATNAGTEVTTVTDSTSVTFDKTLPTIAFTQNVVAGPINSDTVELTVTETNVDIATYYYAFSADGTCDGTDTYDQAYVSATPFTFNTASNNGSYICGKAVDMAGNIGYSAASANDLNIDIIAPTGYSVSIVQAYVNNANKTATSFTFAGAEVGSTYNYSISTTGAGGPVTGTGVVGAADETIASIDVSGLGDGTLTYSVTLTDVATNVGGAVTDTVVKDVANPASAATIANALYGSTTYVTNTVNGTASDTGGTGVASVTITIQEGAGNYWTGTEWGASTPLPVVGTTAWTYNSATAITHTDTLVYTVTPTATDTAGNSVAGTADTYTWDGTVPTITSYSSSLIDGSYKAGTVIDVDVTFSEAVTTASAITLTMDTGGTCVIAPFSNSATATCNYTVGAGHTSADLTVSSFAAAGAVTDQGGNVMVSWTPTGNNLAANKAFIIDTTAPVVSMGTEPGTKAVAWSQNATVTETNTIGLVYAWTHPTSLPYPVTFGTSNAEDTTIAGSGVGYYTVRLTATDLAGNVGTGDLSFTWTSVNTPISGYSPSSGATGAAIAAGNATVTFAPIDPAKNVTLIDATKVTIVKDSDGSDVANGAASISGGNNTSKILLIPHDALENSTKYRINILAGAVRDADGHINSDGVSYFTTVAAASESTPPTVTVTATSTTQTTASITFTSDEAGTAKVGYGLTATHGNMTSYASMISGSNSISLAGLTCGTTYHYTVYGKDSLNNEANTADATIVTAACTTVDSTSPTVTVTATSTTQTTASITFTSDEAGTAKVGYGLTASHGNMTSYASMISGSNSISLAGLTCNTTYHYTVYGKDSLNNEANTADATVLTAACTEPTEISSSARLIKRIATKNGVYADGWKWILDVSLPTASSTLELSFDNLTGAGTIPASSSIRFYSAQFVGHTATSTAISVVSPGAGTAWSDAITLSGDTSSNPGRQLEITVEAAVPSGSPDGYYSASYDLR